MDKQQIPSNIKSTNFQRLLRSRCYIEHTKTSAHIKEVRHALRRPKNKNPTSKPQKDEGLLHIFCKQTVEENTKVGEGGPQPFDNLGQAGN